MSETVDVRYMVNDVEAAIAWYTTQLGFSLLSSYAPAFADVQRGALRLLLSGPTSSAGRPMPDARGRGRAAGTASISSSITSTVRSSSCAAPASCSATTSSPVPEGRRSF